MGAGDVWPPRSGPVGWWLLAVAVLVAAMIAVGGATRLTDSGLSITQWDLAKGLTPPMSDARWSAEFALYRQTMEFQTQNSDMTLAQFKSIYWWEWGHRFLGKVLGVVFVVPALIFLFMGRLRGRFRVTGLLFLLGAVQGAIGWWMVTSGLFTRLDVSPVRLAVHLGMAFLILAILVWAVLGCFAWPREASRIGSPRWTPIALLAAIFAQVLLGALLAGSDGGAAFADWPRIGGEWIPRAAFELTPGWRNLTDDHATQHLLHRSAGYAVALLALVMAAAALVRGSGAARWSALGVGAAALVQAGLGVLTVLAATPPWLAFAHQSGAVLLWVLAAAALRAARR